MSDFHPGDIGLVLDEVADERRRQHEKWGQQDHTPGFWFLILGEEVGEANKACLEAVVDHVKVSPFPQGVKGLSDRRINWDEVDLTEMRKELIQVAAVAVAMIEKIDRGNW